MYRKVFLTFTVLFLTSSETTEAPITTIDSTNSAIKDSSELVAQLKSLEVDLSVALRRAEIAESSKRCANEESLTVAGLQQELHSAKRQHQRNNINCMTTIAELRSEVSESNQISAKLTKDVEAKKKALRDEQDAKRALEGTIKRMQDEGQSLQKDLALLKQRDTDVRQARADLILLRTELSQVQFDAESLKSQKSGLQSDLDAERKANKKLIWRHGQLEAEVNSTRGLGAELATMKDSLQKRDASVAALTADLDSTRKHCEHADTTISELKAKLNVAELAAKSALTRADDAMHVHAAEAASLLAQAKHAEGRAEAAEALTSILRSSLEEANNRTETKLIEHNAQLALIKSEQERIAAVHLDALREALAQSEAARTELAGLNATTLRAHSAFQEEIEKLKEGVKIANLDFVAAAAASKIEKEALLAEQKILLAEMEDLRTELNTTVAQRSESEAQHRTELASLHSLLTTARSESEDLRLALASVQLKATAQDHELAALQESLEASELAASAATVASRAEVEKLVVEIEQTRAHGVDLENKAKYDIEMLTQELSAASGKAADFQATARTFESRIEVLLKDLEGERSTAREKDQAAIAEQTRLRASHLKSKSDFEQGISEAIRILSVLLSAAPPQLPQPQSSLIE